MKVKDPIFEPTMKLQLIKHLQSERLKAGKNDKPLGWQSWSKRLGVSSKCLFNFCRGDETQGAEVLKRSGQGTLGIEALRRLARYYAANDAMIVALAQYALMVEMP